MFVVFSKEKILSYLISLSTVAFLFIMSFAITKRNEEVIKTSANILEQNVTNGNIIGNDISMENSILNETIEDNVGNITKKLQK